MTVAARKKRLGALHLSLSLLVVAVSAVFYGPLSAGIGTLTLQLMIIAALPQLIAGVALLTARSWAFPVVMIAGALSLISIPLGTVLGLYTFSVMTSPDDGGEDDLSELP